jgi:hypothetical protein
LGGSFRDFARFGGFSLVSVCQRQSQLEPDLMIQVTGAGRERCRSIDESFRFRGSVGSR